MANKSKKTTPSKAPLKGALPDESDKFNPDESNLVNHAKREIELAGIAEQDADYGGAIAKCVLDLVTVFAKQRHSGGSAELTMEIFNEVIAFRPLTPITKDPAEWRSVSKEFGEPMWQNIRWSAIFSKDGGKTAFHSLTKEPIKLISKEEFDAQRKKALTSEPKADK